jgi:ABC-type polysaccharide/polyol phosphate transport system ATPase subunit
MSIIEVQHLTKEFRLGQLRTLRQSLAGIAGRLRGDKAAGRAPFKALDDVSFSVDAGEVVGIIGHNGAGKSTLLKILSGISKPTQGRATVRGRVAPLIEVSAGLVPDLTGRENVIVNATILGMRRAEVARKFDEIVAFAELEEFIDTPVKRYSSGMQIRLGFAIATSIESNILIVDEVLAVGDLAFQRKCFDRMEEIIKKRGTTVLLVSHNVRQVERLCGRAILLDRGHLLQDGRAGPVCDAYYSSMNKTVFKNVETQRRAAAARVVSSGEVELIDVRIKDDKGQVKDAIVSGEPLNICIRFRLRSYLERPEFHVGTHTTDFFYVTGNSTALVEERPDFPAAEHEISLRVASYPMKPGVYGVRFAVLDKMRRVLFHGETLHVFSVLASASEALQDEFRLVDLPASWSLTDQRSRRQAKI